MKEILKLGLLIFLVGFTNLNAHNFGDVDFIEGSCRNVRYVPNNLEEKTVYTRVSVYNERDYYICNGSCNSYHSHYNYYSDMHHRRINAFNRGRFETSPYTRSVEFIYNTQYQGCNSDHITHYYTPVHTREEGHFESCKFCDGVKFVHYN